MYKKISKAIADIFLNKKILSEDKYALFKYGCELIISNIVYTLIFLIMSMLTNTLVPSLLFYAGFLITRKFCGGYHASSYIRCHLLFAFTHFLFVSFTSKKLIINPPLHCCLLKCYLDSVHLIKDVFSLTTNDYANSFSCFF